MPDPCPNCGPLQAEVERLRLEVERLQNRHSNGVIESIAIGDRKFYTEDRSTREIRREMNARLIVQQRGLATAERRIRELEQALAESLDHLQELDTELMDGVVLPRDELMLEQARFTRLQQVACFWARIENDTNRRSIESMGLEHGLALAAGDPLPGPPEGER